MAGPWPHPKTGILWYRKATPSDIWAARDRLNEIGVKVTREVQRSLGTRNRQEAELAYSKVSVEVEEQWGIWRALLASGPTDLNHRNLMALAGGNAKAYVEAFENQPQLAAEGLLAVNAVLDNIRLHYSMQSLPEGQAAFEFQQELLALPMAKLVANVEVLRREDPHPIRRRIAATLHDTLRRLWEDLGWHKAPGLASAHGVQLTKSGRKDLGAVVAKRSADAWAALNDRLEGDYSEPKWISGLPTFEHAIDPAPPQPGGKAPLTELVELWWPEAKASGRAIATFEAYKQTFRKLSAFLKAKAPHLVNHEDIVSFKDHRIASGIAPKTIRDGDLAAIRSVFSWAVSNGYATTNPAKEVKIIKPKATRLRGKDFTPDEAKAILTMTVTYQPGEKELPKTTLAKRWVPRLCAYSGARVGEIVQLRPQDVTREGDHVVITITPEANTVKDKELRKVVLHEHIAEGFMAVAEAARGDQFIFIPNTDAPRSALAGIASRVGELARGVAKGVSPNHGWRHTFKSMAREAGIADSVSDAITGHAPANEGGNYGTVSLQAQAKALEAFPRFPVDFQAVNIRGVANGNG